jgi:hypothetical protein
VRIKGWIANTVVVVAMIVWFLNFSLPVIFHDFQASDAVNTIFLLVVGAVLPLKIRRSDHNEPDDDNDNGHDQAGGDRK